MDFQISPADPLGTFNPIDAWLSLTQVQRDMIGVFAIRAAFGALVAQHEFDASDRLLTAEVRAQGCREEDLAGLGLTQSIAKALPQVFGRDGEDPNWLLAGQRPGRDLSDAEVAMAAINGLRRLGMRCVEVPASMLEA